MNKVIEKLKQIGIPNENISGYGKDIAKIDWQYIEQVKPTGKLILVSAITPTPLGEGKTTVSIGLTDGLNSIGKKAVVALREPSLGPVFGRKGGATGGGQTEIHPVDKINLHFTGDFHAITSAHNLIAAMIEQQLFFALSNINPATITWKRALDMNDRHLRHITIKINDDISYQGGFQITASSEIMAILCLAENFAELRTMLDNIVFAYDYDGQPLKVATLNITDSLLALLIEAYSPNAVLTTAGNLAFVHGGPFANIAHGCNSILATKLALSHADYTITEAGFGSDLGAEKFLDIKAPKLKKLPDAVVLVATVRALKYHAGVDMADIETENIAAIQAGLANLQKHIDNIKYRNLPLVVTVNVFANDTTAELACIKDFVEAQQVTCALNTAYADGANGATDLAEKVIAATEQTYNYQNLYEWTMPLKEKITNIATKVYGATAITYTEVAEQAIVKFGDLVDNLPVCIAKTPDAFTQNGKDRGLPKPFIAEVRNIKVINGAGMIVVYMGGVIDMPGLPKVPNAQKITIDSNYEIHGVE